MTDICTECGLIPERHVMEMRGDGVMVAGVMLNGEWIVCGVRRERRNNDRMRDLELLLAAQDTPPSS